MRLVHGREGRKRKRTVKVDPSLRVETMVVKDVVSVPFVVGRALDVSGGGVLVGRGGGGVLEVLGCGVEEDGGGVEDDGGGCELEGGGEEDEDGGDDEGMEDGGSGGVLCMNHVREFLSWLEASYDEGGGGSEDGGGVGSALVLDGRLDCARVTVCELGLISLTLG